MNLAMVLVLLPMIALGSCASGSPEKALCEAAIKDQLINPETAQFFDFAPATVGDWREGVANYIWKERGISFNERGNYGKQLDEAIASAQNVVMPFKPRFHTMRVKADSKLGLLVTANYVCAAAEGECACANNER